MRWLLLPEEGLGVKDATRERVEAETAGWKYMEELPSEWFGFRLVRDMRVHGDIYDLYSYAAEARHRGITAYFHEETKRILQFDGPHPGHELYRYQIKKVIQFLREVGEIR